MFHVPDRYAVNKPLDAKVFTPRGMKKLDKDRIRQSLLASRLIWQIAGEEIPSRVDDAYNCSVIMGLECKLKSVKDIAFCAEQVQHMIKAPCVVRFYNGDEEVYSFAHKRLSQNDHTQIVVLERVQTPVLSQVFQDKTATLLNEYLDFDAIKNRTDKLNYYLEAMVKAFLISHLDLFSGIRPLLDDKIWFNLPDFMVVFAQMKELVRLHKELELAQLPAEKAGLIGKIKALQEEITRHKGATYEQ